MMFDLSEQHSQASRRCVSLWLSAVAKMENLDRSSTNYSNTIVLALLKMSELSEIGRLVSILCHAIRAHKLTTSRTITRLWLHPFSHHRRSRSIHGDQFSHDLHLRRQHQRPQLRQCKSQNSLWSRAKRARAGTRKRLDLHDMQHQQLFDQTEMF